MRTGNLPIAHFKLYQMMMMISHYHNFRFLLICTNLLLQVHLEIERRGELGISSLKRKEEIQQRYTPLHKEIYQLKVYHLQ